MIGLENLDKLMDYLKSHPSVTEISLEYLSGDKDKVEVAELEGIDWDLVDEVEIELEDGSKLEFGEDKEEEDEDEDEVKIQKNISTRIMFSRLSNMQF